MPSVTVVHPRGETTRDVSDVSALNAYVINRGWSVQSGTYAAAFQSLTGQSYAPGTPGGASTAVPADAGPGGTADDTAAAQAALDSGAKHIVFRQGVTYTISADLIPRSGQTIWAYGSTIRRKAGGVGGGANLISVAAAGNSFIEDVHIHGGIWDGNRAAITGPVQQYRNDNGIRFAWARNCTVTDAVVQNCWGGGIVAGDSIVSNLRISNVTARWNYDNGIWLRPGCLDVIVSDCTAHGQTYHGITAIRSDKVTFTGCHAHDNGPTQSGEGAGFRMEGCRWSEIVNCSSWDHAVLGGIALTHTGEGTLGWEWLGVYNDALPYTPGQVVQWPPVAAGTVSGEMGAWYCITAPPAAGHSPHRKSAYWVPCAFDNKQGLTRNGYQIKISGCRVTGNWGVSTRGTWDPGGSYAPYDSVWYRNGTSWGIYVAKTTHTGSATTPNADTTNWGGAFTPSGIHAYDVDHLQVTDCVVTGNYDGIKVGGTNGGASNVRIRGCDVRNNSHDGVYVGTAVAGTSVEIADSSFDGNANNAIETASAANCAVDIHDSAFTGINFQARALYEIGTQTSISFRQNKVRGQSTEPFAFNSATSWADGTNDMTGRVDHASGTGAFAAATTATVTFATPFKVAPTAAGIRVVPTAAPAGDFYVSAVSATGFTVTCTAAGSWAFAWDARNLAP